MCGGSVIPVAVYSQGELSTLVYLVTLLRVCGGCWHYRSMFGSRYHNAVLQSLFMDFLL